MIEAILLGLLIGGAAVAAVYIFQERRRSSLQIEVERERNGVSAAAVRLADLERQLETLKAEAASAARALSDLRAEARGLAEREKLLTQRNETASKDLQSAIAERQALQEQVVRVSADNSALVKERDGVLSQLKEQKAWVLEQTEHFQKTMTVEAARIMDERGKAFTETNTRQVDAIVAPFKEKLEEFRKRVDEIHTAETKTHGALDERIQSLTSLNRSVSEQAERLVKALTVNSKSSGTWGETILAKILEDSGLRKDHDYRLQPTIKGLEGEDLRPDAILYLPGDRQLVVDSKVSNKAWTDYCSTDDEASREVCLKEHLASLRTHIKGLSGKEYVRSPELKTVDFVLMFVPVEAALLTALVRDHSLYADAYQQRIILVTPTTLMAVVRMAEGLWSFQTRMESVDAIAEAGRKLYEKLTTFAASFVEVGSTIAKAQDQFEKAQGQLATGKGNAIRLAEKMKALGVAASAGKEMPAALLELDTQSDEQVLIPSKESEELAALGPEKGKELN